MDVSEFCTKAQDILVFVGWVLTFFKVAIPLLIIGLGMFDLGKAVVASKDDEIKTQTKRLLWRAVAGVCIFFVPTLVLWLFSAVNDFNTAATASDFETCRNAVLYPWNVSTTVDNG